MGFRSTLISEHYPTDWPDWFKEKHKGWISDSGVIASPYEVKFMDEIIEDTHKALTELDWFSNDNTFSMVSLHECGGLTKIQLNKDGILYADPLDWWLADDPYDHSDGRHNYCYGCSDLRKLNNEGEEDGNKVD